MSRIRTIKPALFRHEELFELEQKVRLPVRLAWMGLFTVADREGRFKWQPNVLKLDILPWDNFDFNLILEALASIGLIKPYEVNGKKYGYIPTWKLHQVIHNTEQKSFLPSPDEHLNGEFTVSSPLTPSAATAFIPQEKEKEKEEEEEVSAHTSFFLEFEKIWKLYAGDNKGSKQAAFKVFLRLDLKKEELNDLQQAVKNYIAHKQTTQGHTWNFDRFLENDEWREFIHAPLANGKYTFDTSNTIGN